MNAAYREVLGDSTRLRPASWGFTEDELRRRYRWSQDDLLQYWSGSIPGGRDFEHFKDSVRERDWPADGHRISYAIREKASNRLIGMVSVYGIDRATGSGEIGIYVGEKDLWGHGYGTDALVAFLRHLFSDLDFRSVYLHTYQSNIRAQRSYVRVGFRTVETKRRYAPRIGYHDEVKMEISRERFTQLHGPARRPVAASS
ncbi:MAG TPA: GNAT family N-acetyltransferase [Chloroflexota bacterium]|nr:GNAT family N-acetyltransferase [Chloroflexota bacterium]